jgi:hypothetical protein
MRDPVKATTGLFYGSVFGILGLLLFSWALFVHFQYDAAFQLALRIVVFLGFVDGDPGRLAYTWAMHENLAAIFGLGFLAAAAGNLYAARTRMRPPDESHDGKVRVELKTKSLRVGAPLEGTVWLKKDPKPDELYRVALLCSRSRPDNQPDENAYAEKQEARPMRGAQGWYLPFRFEIPATTPPTGTGGSLEGGVHSFGWLLLVSPARNVVFFSYFAITLGAAESTELSS